MSCITWAGSASAASAAPRVEAVLPAATIQQQHQQQQRRVTKRARAAPQLADTVREVVSAFEFEYAQTRAESVMLKNILSDRRTQLSDLRRHLEKESSENGTLEAMVDARHHKNDKGDARLARLEREFALVLKDDETIASRVVAFQFNLGAARDTTKAVREMTGVGESMLDQVKAALDGKERAVAQDEKEVERLRQELSRGRQSVQESQCLLRSKQEEAAATRLVAEKAAAELELLTRDTDHFREEVEGRESECSEAALHLEAAKKKASEVKEILGSVTHRAAPRLLFVHDVSLYAASEMTTGVSVSGLEAPGRSRVWKKDVNSVDRRFCQPRWSWKHSFGTLAR